MWIKRLFKKGGEIIAQHKENAIRAHYLRKQIGKKLDTGKKDESSEERIARIHKNRCEGQKRRREKERSK